MKSHPRALRSSLMSPNVACTSPVGRRTRFLLLALLLMPFAGCTSYRDYVKNGFKVGSNYCRPAAAVAEQWLDANDPAISGGPIQNDAWWHSFNDPILDSLISSACRQNLSLRVAGLRILEARA